MTQPLKCPERDAARARLRAQILRVLTSAGEPMTVDDVLRCLFQGEHVSGSAVKGALISLHQSGQVSRDGQLYQKAVP